jgi:leader peptidase (prepilin peptidase)/N-methyltransferase
VKTVSLEVAFLFFAWSLFLFLFAHYLVKDFVHSKKIFYHSPCFILSLFSFLSLLVFFVLCPSHFFWVEFIFLSVLITLSISDFCTMLIPTLLTIGFVPVAFVSAWYGYLPITFMQSIIGALFGYTVLCLFSYVYTKKTGTQGIGEGDFDILALIGAFTGFYGAWSALTIGSALGSCIGFIYYLKSKTVFHSPFPFGPLLAIGSYCYLLYWLMIYA